MVSRPIHRILAKNTRQHWVYGPVKCQQHFDFVLLTPLVSILHPPCLTTRLSVSVNWHKKYVNHCESALKVMWIGVNWKHTFVSVIFNFLWTGVNRWKYYANQCEAAQKIMWFVWTVVRTYWNFTNDRPCLMTNPGRTTILGSDPVDRKISFFFFFFCPSDSIFGVIWGGQTALFPRHRSVILV